MTGDWALTTLGEVVTLQRGFDLPAQSRRDGTVPIVSSSGVSGTHDEARVAAPGVVTGRYGTLGEVHFLTEDFWPLNTTLYVKDFKGNDARFVSYLLSSLDLAAYNDKSSVPGVNRNHLHAMQIRVPRSVDEQRSIADILGALDDKIELNRRMNRTLEELARALFRSWFVDFDPVRAKAAGRAPEGMDAETAALFPSGFEESELGEIPDGWRLSKLGESFNLVMGQSPPGSTYNKDGQGLPFYQGRADFGFRYPKRRVFCTLPTRFADAGETLVSVRAPVGDVNMAAEHCSVGRGVAAIRHQSGSRSYTYYALNHLAPALNVFDAEGTVFGSISKAGLAGLPVLAPPCALVNAFERMAWPLDEAVRVNELQTSVLASLRDALLPKLLSGEVRLREGVDLVAAAS